MNFRAWLPRAAAGLAAAVLLSGCSLAPEPLPTTQRETRTTVLEPQAPGEVVLGNDFAGVDASNTGEGYIQLRYAGEAAKAKVQLTLPDGNLYTYTLAPGDYETLPLTGGSGTYGVAVLENAFDNIYALAYSGEFQAENVDEFKPYLYPNQYVWFTEGSRAAALGEEISEQSADDLDYVSRVYSYVVENITYDKELAASIPVDYVPDLERTLETGKGICLDYASLMTALLRSQGIPTKLVVGYSGTAYHAWISVYLEETGWMDGVIYFDGVSWSRIDPTLAAGNRDTSVKDYVNNNDNYKEKYFY